MPKKGKVYLFSREERREVHKLAVISYLILNKSLSSMMVLLFVTCSHSSDAINSKPLSTWSSIVKILLSNSVFYNRVLLLTPFSVSLLKSLLGTIL